MKGHIVGFVEMTDGSNVDGLDYEIIKILLHDGRTPVAQIARMVGISRTAVNERINRMVFDEIIEFTAVINAKSLGYGSPLFLEIEVKPDMLDKIGMQLSEYPEVSIVYQMTGNTTLHVHAYVRNNDELATFLRDKVYSIRGIVNVNTSMLIKRYKSNLNLR